MVLTAHYRILAVTNRQKRALRVRIKLCKLSSKVKQQSYEEPLRQHGGSEGGGRGEEEKETRGGEKHNTIIIYLNASTRERPVRTATPAMAQRAALSESTSTHQGRERECLLTASFSALNHRCGDGLLFITPVTQSIGKQN